MEQLDRLIEISRYYGDDPDYVIAGGGNTSYKSQATIWVKASGIPLAGITENGFVSLSREKLGRIETGIFSEDPVKREQQVKEAMQMAILTPDKLRPSVETSLHNLIPFAYVVHTHPTLVNALMCSNDVEKEVEARFGSSAILVEYTDPGYVLFKKLQDRIRDYQSGYGRAPKIIFLQNHGVFVGADSVDEVKELYREIMTKISRGRDLELPREGLERMESGITRAIAAHSDSRSLHSASYSGGLISHFTAAMDRLELVSRPFSPDIIVYCKSRYLILPGDCEAGQIPGLLDDFEDETGYYPRVILQEGGGLTAVEENQKSLQTVLEVYLNLMKISYLSRQFGGPHFMSPEQISFIDSWEVENYRRRVAKGGNT